MSESEEDEEFEVEEESDEEEEETEAVEETAEFEFDGGDDVSSDEEVIQKLDSSEVKDARIVQTHPQEACISFAEIQDRLTVHRDEQGNVQDTLHQTTPVMTKYELTRILGTRLKQLDEGCEPFIKTDECNNYKIAEAELRSGKLPFIVQRPLPNGEHEYWQVSDLEIR